MINRVRLPFYISKSQFPTERNVFRKADGSSKILSVVIKNTHKGITDYLPEDWHRKLIVALSHDEVTIENERYLTDIVLDSEYEIEWQDFKDFPLAQGNFTVQSSPFDATNSNCVTCEEVSQAVLVDDTFEDPLDEDTLYSINVTDNDTICCYPFTLSISWYDTNYILSPTLNSNGVLSFTTEASFSSGTNVKIATYRVTCADGTYDEADVYADMNGTATVCAPPTNVIASSVTDTTATLSWDAAIPPPAVGYIWELYDAANPTTILQTGTTAGTSVNLTGLLPDFNYLFQVYSDCDGSNSTRADGTFTTDGTNNNCAEFLVSFMDADPPVVASYSYLDCNQVIQTVDVLSGTAPVSKCMLIISGQTVPYYFQGSRPEITYTYVGLC